MRGKHRRLMTLWCLAVMGFGLLLSLGAFPATDAPVRLLLTLLSGGTPPEMSAALRFCMAVMGPVTLGWAITLLGITRVSAMLTGPALSQLWMFTAAGVILWAVIDSILSVATGFALNVLPNLIYVGAFLAILLSSGVLKGASKEE